MTVPFAGFRPAREAASRAACACNLASFTIGAEAGNVINVAVQLKDAKGRPVVERVAVMAYLSDNSDGSTLTATVPTSNIAIGTNGLLIAPIVANKTLMFVSDASGRFDLNIPQTAAPVTYYLVVVMPDGSLVKSGAITFA